MKITNLGDLAITNYLIDHDGTKILIDTGYEEAYPRFLNNLAAQNLASTDINFLFLTHAHDDHAGFLKRLLADAPGLRVIASPLAKAGLIRGQNGPGGGAPDENAIAACVRMIEEGHGAHRFPALTEDEMAGFLWVTDANRGDIENLLDGKIVTLPGHTEDSIGLFIDGLLFCGDAAQNRPDVPLKTTIWIGDMQTYAGSWEKIIALMPEKIYPGHGAPFDAAILAKQLLEVRQITLLNMPRIKRAKK